MGLPSTLHNLGAMTCISALQKMIRRGHEREAMQFAVELMHSSKSFHTMVCNRLQIISHEDIDTIAQPWIVPFVRTACEQAQEFYKPDRPGAARMMVGNAIRLMCRAKKSREGDHFQAVTGLAQSLEGFVPEVPDFAYDKHTIRGRRLGRGLDHFRTEGTKLVPPPEQPDPYEEEAYRLWALQAARGANRRGPRSPDRGHAMAGDRGLRRSRGRGER